MGQVFAEITPALQKWIAAQHVFFVGTAPLAAGGHVNCSPKGRDAFRVLGPRQVGYLDLTGSGAETIAHLRENGRIVFMFCAFEGPPRIVRLHGQGRVVTPQSPDWAALGLHFPSDPAQRSIVVAEVARISDSCGYGVPNLAFQSERDTMRRWAETKGYDQLPAYRRQKNLQSIDGLPALDAGET
jgi:hypothetical protein